MTRTQENNRLKKEVMEVIVLILILIGGVYGINAILKSTLNTSKPIVVVEGHSMEPKLYQGDILIIKGKNPEDIKIGDIIVFNPSTWPNPPDKPVVHRVIDIKYDEEKDQYLYLTKGDNNATNPVPDPAWVPDEDVYGVVIFTIPRIGIISLKLREQPYLATIIIGVLIVLMIVLTLWEKPEEEMEKQQEETKTAKVLCLH